MKIIAKGIANISSQDEILDVFFPCIQFGDNEVFKGISAKQLGILITEERNDLITRFDHALYLGRELQKAEECLYKKLPYIQD